MWNLLSMWQKLAFGQETVLQPLRPALRVDRDCRKNAFKEAGFRNISYLSKGKDSLTQSEGHGLSISSSCSPLLPCSHCFYIHSTTDFRQ